jgi:hypothetical protein
MKKLISSLVLATTISTANAMPTLPNMGTPRQHYNNSYESGYRAGKSHAYNKVAKVMFFTGFTVIAGVIIYQLGKESRWEVNENGVVYRF